MVLCGEGAGIGVAGVTSGLIAGHDLIGNGVAGDVEEVIWSGG
jgi:hypothetical protein